MYRPREFRAFNWPVKRIESFPAGLSQQQEYMQHHSSLETTPADSRGLSVDDPSDAGRLEEKTAEPTRPSVVPISPCDLSLNISNRKRNIADSSTPIQAAKRARREDVRSGISSVLSNEYDENNFTSTPIPSLLAVIQDQESKNEERDVNFTSEVDSPPLILGGERVIKD